MPTAKISDFAFTHRTDPGWWFQQLTVRLAFTDLSPLWSAEEFNANTTRAWLVFKTYRDDYQPPYGCFGVLPKSTWLEVEMNRPDFDQTATLLREHKGHLFAGWVENPDVASYNRDPFILSTERSELPSALWWHQKLYGDHPDSGEQTGGSRRAPASTAPSTAPATTAETLNAVSLLSRLLTERDRPATLDDDELSRRLGSLLLRSVTGDAPA